MAFPVQNIRNAAKCKGLSLSHIEKSLGIGNGVIAKWEKNKGTPPYDRIVAIAEFLDVPVSVLTGEDIEKANEQNEMPAPISESELDNLLLQKLMDLTPDEIIKVTAYIDGLIANRK